MQIDKTVDDTFGAGHIRPITGQPTYKRQAAFSTRTRTTQVMIVGDTHAFGKVMSEIKARGGSTVAPIRRSTYERFSGMLTQRMLRETDLFVLELWRTYPTGLRAEGLAVAQELRRLRSKALVISPLFVAGEVNLPWYWDLGATDSVDARCTNLLLSSGQTERSEELSLAILRNYLRDYLAKPQGHGSDIGRSYG
jgi:hypothetical protein